jgi:hypothetical protein
LIQHEIGVKKKTVGYYEFDETVFQASEPEEADGMTGNNADEDVG